MRFVDRSISRKPMTLMSSLLAVGLLSACAAGTEELSQGAEPRGTAFTNALARDYRSFTDFEANKMYDWTDADHFADKTLRARSGELVPPEQLAAWDLPADKVDELAAARQRLVAASTTESRDRYPFLLARAQSRFDCWVEQQEENHQLQHIALCRDGYYEAISLVETRLTARVTEPKSSAAAGQPEFTTVYFDFDSAELSPQDAEVAEQAAATAEGEIYITGFADRAGPAGYNMDLSLRRAKAVESVLIRQGVAADRIGVAGRGENDLAIPTADGVKMPANRRVEIVAD